MVAEDNRKVVVEDIHIVVVEDIRIVAAVDCILVDVGHCVVAEHSIVGGIRHKAVFVVDNYYYYHLKKVCLRLKNCYQLRFSFSF